MSTLSMALMRCLLRIDMRAPLTCALAPRLLACRRVSLLPSVSVSVCLRRGALRGPAAVV